MRKEDKWMVKETLLSDNPRPVPIYVPRLPLESVSESIPEKSVILSNGHNKSDRHKKIFSVWQLLSLRGIFQLLGQCIGQHPIAFMIVALAIAMLSMGMSRIVLKDRIRDGYTPMNAPSRYETDVMREFWNSSGDPMMTVVLVMAKDGGSMLRDEHLNEAERLLQFMIYNFSITYDDQVLFYRQLCFPYCGINLVFQMFKEGYDAEKRRLLSGQSLSPDTDLIYPVAKVDGFEIHLERSFYGVKLRDKPNKTAGQMINKSDGLSIAQRITNLDSIKVILMLFRGDKGTPELDNKLAKWEMALYQFSRNEYNNSFVEIQVAGSEILDQEMIRDGRRLTPFFAAGFGLMMIFVFGTVITSAVFYDEMDGGKLLVALGAVLSPMLAITTSYGVVSLMGLRVNSFSLIMPFLITGIGVDDAFLMIHSWQRLAPHGHDVSQRLGLVLAEIGPSITITSLTNFISFGIGATTPTPEIQLFCFTTAMAMGFDYIFELILFGPILVMAARFERKKKPVGEAFTRGWRAQVDGLAKKLLKFYCRLLGHTSFLVFLAMLTLTYWYFAITGAINMKTKLDTAKVLPRESPLQIPNRILHESVWSEYHPVSVLINSPLNITSKHSMDLFWKMLEEFETQPLSIGKRSTLLWLRDYEQYSHGDFDIFGWLGGDNQPGGGNGNGTATETGLNYDRLYEFLSLPFYKHWRSFIRVVDIGGSPRVQRFWFSVAYRNTSAWEQRIDLMETWRDIVARYAELNATVWEANGMFVDQMLSLKPVALQTGVLTLLCMAVVCALFIPNPCSVISASLAIASISIGVFGFLSWWHFDLDPVIMAAVLMSIGLSVDFTAHVSFHYQLSNKKELHNGQIIKVPIKGWQAKLEHTMESVAWPMLQAGTSTVMCVLPLIFLRSYAPDVFLKSIVLVVAWGLLHGLLILPAFLCCLPDCMANINCYRIFLSTSSEKSCRYKAPVVVEVEDHELDDAI